MFSKFEFRERKFPPGGQPALACTANQACLLFRHDVSMHLLLFRTGASEVLSIVPVSSNRSDYMPDVFFERRSKI